MCALRSHLRFRCIRELAIYVAEPIYDTSIRRQQVMAEDKSVNLDFGDIVEHRKFGVGKIVDIERNKLTIIFDENGEKRVLNTFVERIKPGHDKGVRYWQKQWDELTNEWLEARKKVSAAMPQLFRPMNSQNSVEDLRSQLTELEGAEQEARSKLEAFLAEEAADNHL